MFNKLLFLVQSQFITVSIEVKFKCIANMIKINQFIIDRFLQISEFKFPNMVLNNAKEHLKSDSFQMFWAVQLIEYSLN